MVQHDSQVALREEDIFIVSYPRSGNTWGRFLLANLLAPDRDIDFHTIHKIIPDLEKNPKGIDSLPRPRIIKSHSSYCSEYSNVIYIVRDGRDVSVSYYEFLRGRQRFEGSFLDFLRDKQRGPFAWNEHVVSWLDNSSNLNFLLVKYEDLHRNAVLCLKQMAEFVGLETGEEDIIQAVNKCSFKQMKRIEQERGRLYKKGEEDLFMRKGAVGSWKEYFEGEHLRLFSDLAGETLLRLGYVF